MCRGIRVNTLEALLHGADGYRSCIGCDGPARPLATRCGSPRPGGLHTCAIGFRSPGPGIVHAPYRSAVPAFRRGDLRGV